MSKLETLPSTFPLDNGPEDAGASAGRLNSQPALNDRLQRLRSHIIQSDERGLPRYGVLSVLARRVPFHLYDHPSIVELCDTAFTDGIHLFVHTAFLTRTVAEDQLGSPPTQSMTLILLHELSHILFCHHARFPANAPPLLWAIACDIAINVRLLAGYPGLSPGTLFAEAWGARPGDAERFLGESEEHLLFGLWNAPEPDDQPFIDRLKHSLQSAGGNADRRLDCRGRQQDIHGHLITPEKLAETLDRNGLRHVRQALKLPDPNDRPAFQELVSASALFLTGDLDQAKELREVHPLGKAMAGEHLEHASAEWIDNERFGRLEWKNLLRELMLGDGMRYEHCDELPSDIYFVEPAQMGLDAPLYLGSPTPASPAGVAVCVVDTSRSVTTELLKVFVGELNNLVDYECVSEHNIYIVSADSALRSEILPATAHRLSTAADRLSLQGRGGTDITRVINEVLHWSDQQQEFNPSDLAAIVYFTDLLDRPPKREALPARLPQVLFLAPPSSAVRDFRRAVASFASVTEIRDGTVIDL